MAGRQTPSLGAQLPHYNTASQRNESRRDQREQSPLACKHRFFRSGNFVSSYLTVTFLICSPHPQMVFQKPCLINMTQSRADFFFFKNPPSYFPSQLDQLESFPSQELRGSESPSLHEVGFKICTVEPTQNGQIKQRIPTGIQIFDKKYRICLCKYAQILDRKHTKKKKTFFLNLKFKFT